jgi:hypothetical protein
MKIRFAMMWITGDAVVQMRKYEVAEYDIWNIVYNFANTTDRGKKLIALVKSRDDEQEGGAYKKLKSL